VPALILAFDGVLADTLGIRADAIVQILHDEQIPSLMDTVRAALPGRSLYETIEHVAASDDIKLMDLMTLRAQRLVSARLAQGVSLDDTLTGWLHTSRSNTRVVLRADSIRADVERVLAMTPLADRFATIRCADDAPRIVGASSLESSYAAIAQRLGRLSAATERTATELTAIEATAAIADTARGYVGHAQVFSSTIRLTPPFD
jgi:beta-phosphoglucomutase-like phosphatase (HAD superfamily)